MTDLFYRLPSTELAWIGSIERFSIRLDCTCICRRRLAFPVFLFFPCLVAKIETESNRMNRIHYYSRSGVLQCSMYLECDWRVKIGLGMWSPVATSTDGRTDERTGSLLTAFPQQNHHDIHSNSLACMKRGSMSHLWQNIKNVRCAIFDLI